MKSAFSFVLVISLLFFSCKNWLDNPNIDPEIAKPVNSNDGLTKVIYHDDKFCCYILDEWSINPDSGFAFNPINITDFIIDLNIQNNDTLLIEFEHTDVSPDCKNTCDIVDAPVIELISVEKL